ncbi:MAG: hypothetical protein OEV61_08155 [Chloroflexota bacterium]|jgi:hypothetical protein|nr:hypothetical protein [Chloroflexota bacterium]
MSDEAEGPQPGGRDPDDLEDREPRPIIERIGMAVIATVIAVLFGGVAAAAWVGGEPFLAIMAAIGCLMTVWVGAMTLFRG